MCPNKPQGTSLASRWCILSRGRRIGLILFPVQDSPAYTIDTTTTYRRFITTEHRNPMGPRAEASVLARQPPISTAPEEGHLSHKVHLIVPGGADKR